MPECQIILRPWPTQNGYNTGSHTILKTSRHRQSQIGNEYIKIGTSPKLIFRQHKANTRIHKTQKKPGEETSIGNPIYST